MKVGDPVKVISTGHTGIILSIKPGEAMVSDKHVCHVSWHFLRDLELVA